MENVIQQTINSKSLQSQTDDCSHIDYPNFSIEYNVGVCLPTCWDINLKLMTLINISFRFRSHMYLITRN